MHKLLTKDNRLTQYGLACGYVDRYEDEQKNIRVTLSSDDHQSTHLYWVHHYSDGLRTNHGYINHKQAFDTLTQARLYYDMLVRLAQQGRVQ